MDRVLRFANFAQIPFTLAAYVAGTAWLFDWLRARYVTMPWQVAAIFLFGILGLACCGIQIAALCRLRQPADTYSSKKPNEWSRLTEQQMKMLAGELQQFGQLRLLVLPGILPDCEDLADDIVAAALRGGWGGTQALRKSRAGITAEGISAEPTSNGGFEVRSKFIVCLSLLLNFPVEVLDSHLAGRDLAMEEWRSRTSVGEDLQLKIGRKVRRQAVSNDHR